MANSFENPVSPQENSQEKMDAVLSRVDGLKETLEAWCNPFPEEGPLSFEEVIRQMADNKDVREAVKIYFSGPGSKSDAGYAQLKSEETAWALAEEFEKRLSAKETE